MKITRQKRYEYRDLLIKKGVPEEIAVIASERLQDKQFFAKEKAHWLIYGGFSWVDTPEGFDIWAGVFLQACEKCK